MARKKNDKYAKYRRNSKEKRKKNRLFAGIVLAGVVLDLTGVVALLAERAPAIAGRIFFTAARAFEKIHADAPFFLSKIKYLPHSASTLYFFT